MVTNRTRLRGNPGQAPLCIAALPDTATSPSVSRLISRAPSFSTINLLQAIPPQDLHPAAWKRGAVRRGASAESGAICAVRWRARSVRRISATTSVSFPCKYSA